MQNNDNIAKDYNDGKVTMGYRLKKFFGFFRISNLQGEIKQLGYSMTTGKILAFLFAFGLAAFIAGVLLHLQPIYVGMLATGFVACVPSLIISYFHHSYEVTRFHNITSYMEQMIYAFHKNNKIRNALIDVRDISSGEIRELATKMIEIIDNNDGKHNPYIRAFDYFESYYNCSRLKTLHRYFIEIEQNGGESKKSLNMLLDDIREWTERTLEYQADRKNVQNKVLLSTLFAMLSCGLMINMIPEEYVNKIIATPAYQIGTCIILILCLVVYVFASHKVGISYLDNEIDTKDSDYEKQAAEYVANYTTKIKAGKTKKPMIIKGIITLIATGVCFILAHIMQNDMFKMCGILVLTVGSFVTIERWLKFRNYSNAIKRNISKMFPEWLRSVVLYLQTDNVHVSILKSYNTCPNIIRPEVEKLIHGIEQDPTTNVPYNNFLEGYNLPHLKLAANYLYSIAMFGSDDMHAQLTYLIQQNQRLTLNSEKTRNEDALAGFTMLMLAPMLLAVAKLMLDLILFIGIFMTMFSSYGMM